jgi:hypothetical protein
MSEQTDTELLVPEDTAGFIARGRSDDGNRHPALAERACCCPSRPAVRVLVPRAGDSADAADLLLCLHHYRASRETLARMAATITFMGDGF